MAEKIKSGGGPRIWKLKSLDEITRLPQQIQNVVKCRCGEIFAYAGTEQYRPPCPRCQAHPDKK
jgi:formylmethanofuran dehydrogenase subunit E